MSAAILEVTIQRGDNDPAVVWQIVDDAGNPFMEPSSSFVLMVTWRGGSIRKDSGVSASGLTYDAETATVTWTPTTAESASLPKGRLSWYTLQRRDDDNRRVFVEGMITGLGDPVS